MDWAGKKYDLIQDLIAGRFPALFISLLTIHGACGSLAHSPGMQGRGNETLKQNLTEQFLRIFTETKHLRCFTIFAFPANYLKLASFQIYL